MAFGDDIFLRGLKRQEKKKEREAQTSFQKGDWRGQKVEGKSASAEFMREVAETKEDPFVTALHTIARTANVLENAAEGKEEKNLSVAWASGKEGNSINGETVFLSPDVISRETTLKPEWTLPERIDVLSADALLLSTLKRTASEKAFEKVKADELASEVWYSLESLNAEREILGKFPGFEDYFAASRSYFCDKNAKAGLEGRIAMAHAFGQGDPAGAVAALKWEMMYPDQPLMLPESYRKAVDWAKEKCLETDSSISRAKAAGDINRQFLEWFPAPPSGGDGDDGKKGEGEGEGGGGGGGGEGEDSDGDSGDSGDNEEKAGDEDKDGKKDEKDEKGKDGEGKDDKEGKGDKDGKKDEKDGKGDDKDGKEGKGKEKPEQKPEPKKPLPKLPNIGQARKSLSSSVENKSYKAIAGRTTKIDDNPIPSGNPHVEVEDADNWKNGTEVHKMPYKDKVLPYRRQCNELRARIGALKDRIKLQAEEATLFFRGLKSGLLDDGSLVKLCVDRNEDCVFEAREILGKPSIAFGLLIDESGSMAAPAGNGLDRCGVARNVAIMLAETLKGFDGLSLCVMGHTTGVNSGGETLLMRYYLTPDNPHIESIMGAHATADNLDGYAMEHAVRKMAEWFPEVSNKHLMVISDGQPAGYGYGGPSAARQMRKVCDAARVVHGINVVGIGIDNAYPPEVGAAMYGPGKSVVLDDSMGAITVLANYITKIVQRANVLR